jgi:hypothetical protein
MLATKNGRRSLESVGDRPFGPRTYSRRSSFARFTQRARLKCLATGSLTQTNASGLSPARTHAPARTRTADPTLVFRRTSMSMSMIKMIETCRRGAMAGAAWEV